MDAQALSKQLSLQFMEALSESIVLDGVPQLIQPFQAWDWGGENYPIGMVPYEQVAALDNVPNTPVENSEGEGAAGRGFADRYLLFLRMLEPKITDDPEYKRLQRDVRDAQDKLNSATNSAEAAWANYKKRTTSTMSFTEWLDGPGAAYNSTILQATKELTAAGAAQDAYAEKFQDAISDALATYTGGLLEVNGPFGPVEVAPWLTSDRPFDYVRKITGDHFGGPAVKGSPRSFEIDSSSAEYSASEVWAEAEASFLDWFVIAGGGSYEKVDVSSFSTDYTISFAFEDLETIEVYPGDWYNGAMLGGFANGPFATGFSGFKQGTDRYFFGAQGELARMYTNLVVGYRPTITLDAGEAFSSYLHQRIEGGGVLWIGPFAVEAGGGSDTTKGTVSFDGSAISIKGQGDWPYIVAKLSQWTVSPTP